MQEEIEEDGDFIVNEKDKVVNLTEQGVHKVEQFFHIDNYADIENLEIQHNVTLALRAHYLMFRDKDYVVKDDEVLIVDEFTGRIMPDVVIQMVFIRLLKLRNTLRLRERVRHLQLLHSRISLISLIRKLV